MALHTVYSLVSAPFIPHYICEIHPCCVWQVFNRMFSLPACSGTWVQVAKRFIILNWAYDSFLCVAASLQRNCNLTAPFQLFAENGNLFLNLTASLLWVLGWEKGPAKAISNGSDKCFFHSKFLSSAALGWNLQLIIHMEPRTERPVYSALSFVPRPQAPRADEPYPRLPLRKL